MIFQRKVLLSKTFLFLALGNSSSTKTVLTSPLISASSGIFKWAETHQVPEYTNWKEGEPNNLNGGQDCVHKSLEPEYSGWDDIECDRSSKADYDAGIYALCMKTLKSS